MGLIIFFILRGSKHMYSYKKNIQKMHIRDFELRTVELLIVRISLRMSTFVGFDIVNIANLKMNVSLKLHKRN